MTFVSRVTRVGLALAFAVSLAGLAPTGAQADHHEGANPCNPCAGKNPCNPCAGSNPCNPCAGKNPCNPCAGKNPCNPCAGSNPCNPCAGKTSSVDPERFTQPEGMTMGGGDTAALVTQGEQLWNDTSLSTNGASCNTCHAGNAQFQASFAKPYPHKVAMVEQLSGVPEVNAAEMVQFCMLQPMQTAPLPWGSRQLAALAAYVENLRTSYTPAANPCSR